MDVPPPPLLDLPYADVPPARDDALNFAAILSCLACSRVASISRSLKKEEYPSGPASLGTRGSCFGFASSSHPLAR